MRKIESKRKSKKISRIGENLLNHHISKRLWKFMKNKGYFGTIEDLSKPNYVDERMIYSDNEKKLFFKTGKHTIGRATSCDLQIADATVSRLQAEVVVEVASI